LKLFEYEAKTVLAKYGVSVPQGVLVSSPSQVREFAAKLRMPVAVKAQVLVAGRGKAGGIRFADSVGEAEKITEKLLGMQIMGMAVRNVWIEEKIEVKKELYFGVTIDRCRQRYVAVASGVGGTDIEEVSRRTPEKVVTTPLDPNLGLPPFQAKQIARGIGYSGTSMLELGRIFEKLYLAGVDCDAELIEMNPLVEASDGTFVAADGRMIIDDNALFRHQEYKKKLLEGETDLSPEELEALEEDLAYVKLDGNIGVIGNGAGLVMATLDTVQYYGGRPADFLDVGGGAPSEKTALALKLVLSDARVKVLLINILGGITRCDEVARGILDARKRTGVTKPMVIRLVGTNEEAGKKMLAEAGIDVLESMEEAAQRAVEIAREGGTSGDNS
jgi:succinyl-CoA synthetase beta subunit